MLKPMGTFRTYRKKKTEIKEKGKEYHETYPLYHLNVQGQGETVGIQIFCIRFCVGVE
jgi:hypothetical protein